MKKLLMLSMLLSFVLVGCGKPTNMTELLNYKGSFVGDNSAVGHIIELLPAHEYLDGFELQTSQEPYEVTINYKSFDEATVELEDGSTSKVALNEVLQGNSMIILSLVTNAEIVNFNIVTFLGAGNLIMGSDCDNRFSTIFAFSKITVLDCDICRRNSIIIQCIWESFCRTRFNLNGFQSSSIRIR